MTRRRVVVRGTVPVELPPDRALHLFTPVGERLWAPGWEPRFPAGEAGDGSAPGTVFLTGADGGETLWVALGRGADTVRYARVLPGVSAGMVEVRLQGESDGSTSAEVTYDLTALSEDGDRVLHDFEAGYAEFLAHWREETAAAVSAGRL